MKEEIIPPRTRMYQGPRQEKQYRKNQRQLLQREQEVLAPIIRAQDKQQLAVIKPDLDITRTVLPSNNNQRTDWMLMAYGFALCGVCMFINASTAYQLGTTEINKYEMAGLGALFEIGLYLGPDRGSVLWKQRRWLQSLVIWIACIPLAAAVLMANLQFASLNFTEATTARAERITPAVSDAQRKLDILSASRDAECTKRGDRCRQLEKEVQTAFQDLRESRERVSDNADPFSATASKLARWFNVRVSPENISLFRLFIFTIIPVFSGAFKMAARS
jgi:hypothetical protein